MSEYTFVTNDSNFEADVVKASVPVLVDFWAPWCNPCRMLAPVLEEIAKDYAGKIKIYKVNVDENNATPSKYGVRGIPALFLFSKGEVLGSQAGALNKNQLKAFIDGLLKSD